MHETKTSIVMIFLRLNRRLMSINSLKIINIYTPIFIYTERVENIVNKYLFELLFVLHIYIIIIIYIFDK